ncbi:hypothetical protein VNO77_41737 [Canavalia gladiata]|uniref:Gnk2-homologous domain-containing protein n=1 Tax=Canavalia gladiata TaxID=3824 RepID=A0AAN9JZ11_CANGL
MIKESPSAVLLFLMFIMISLNSVSGADPVDSYCPREFPFYSVNSTFHNNLKSVLGLLSSNNASKMGFYDISIGKGPNKVYGQALCRGDITNSTVCQECIEKASQDIMKRCNSEDAMIWYELCQVRYSFQKFFSIMVYTGKYPKQNDQQKNVSDPDRFDDFLKYLLASLSQEAAFNSANKFAAGDVHFHGNNKIYGLVQCTRDISGTDCSSCLSSALAELAACCSYREGGIIVSRTCNARFQLSEFFNASLAIHLPDPTFGGRWKWKAWMFVLIACGSVLILAILIGLCIACLMRKVDRDEEKNERALLQELASPKGVAITEEGDLIGLLCVQEDPGLRPTMSNVVVLLGSESMALPQPRHPAFSLGRLIHIYPSTSSNPSVNEIIFSDISPR